MDPAPLDCSRADPRRGGLGVVYIHYKPPKKKKPGHARNLVVLHRHSLAAGDIPGAACTVAATPDGAPCTAPSLPLAAGHLRRMILAGGEWRRRVPAASCAGHRNPVICAPAPHQGSVLERRDGSTNPRAPSPLDCSRADPRLGGLACYIYITNRPQRLDRAPLRSIFYARATLTR